MEELNKDDHSTLALDNLKLKNIDQTVFHLMQLPSEARMNAWRKCLDYCMEINGATLILRLGGKFGEAQYIEEYGCMADDEPLDW